MVLPLFPFEIFSQRLIAALPSLPDNLLTFAMMLMPCVGYFDVLRIMIQKQSNAAYNMQVALILLSANAVKITFWFFEPYPLLIFGQSVFLFIIQIILTYLCYRYKNSPDDVSNGVHLASYRDIQRPSRHASVSFPSRTYSHAHIFSRSLSALNFLKITQAPIFLEFLLCLLTGYIVFLVIFSILWIIIGAQKDINFIGLLGNIIDAFQTFPLFIRIVIQRNANSISIILLLQQVFGDIIKLVIFHLTGSPFVFIIGGLVQFVMDTTNLFFYFIRNKSQRFDNDISRLRKESSSEFDVELQETPDFQQ